MALQHTDGTPCPVRLTAADRAREERSLAVVAWFDGWGQGAGLTRRMDFPRRLDRDEAGAWRDGFAEGSRERRCHTLHGFGPHTGCVLA